ncbi:hypothetical protein AGMMS50284_5570 [Clostridia bacterium]|nr:hypothetical protein AGMMS50284_5570 [Clostridia bacterium]
MTDPVTLTWNGTTLGTSAIKEYVIRESVSTDKGATWSTYQVVATIASTETFGSYLITPPNVDGIYVKYSIGVTDVLGGTTAYRVSNTIYRNTKPKIPTVDAPKIGSKTYNNRPICLIQTQPEPDGQPQTIWVRADGGDWYNSADNPDHFTTQGSTADGIKTVCFFPSELEEGAHSLVIQIRDEYASGTAVERVFSVIPAPFEEILANETHVKARHILDLRTAANTVRNYYNLPAFVWAHEIVPGRTEVRDWPFHIIELRAAIQGVIDKINTFDETAQEIRVAPISWIDIGLGRPRADVMEQLAGLIKQL